MAIMLKLFMLFGIGYLLRQRKIDLRELLKNPKETIKNSGGFNQFKNQGGEDDYDAALTSDTNEAADFGLRLMSEDDAVIVLEILTKDFPFIENWSQSDRDKLIWRTCHIRRMKEFHGHEGLEVTMIHEVIISATLARLTMGFANNYTLPKFPLIEIYPREFYSKLLKQHVKGLTFGHGRLFLSWAHFEEGHKDLTDKIHVGLHEFAHALMLQFNQFRHIRIWRHWLSEAHPIMKSISTSGNHFFRSYGATNIHEFWAVSVETFFEQTEEFKAKYPRLFFCTCRMLNQWPLGRH